MCDRAQTVACNFDRDAVIWIGDQQHDRGERINLGDLTHDAVRIYQCLTDEHTIGAALV